MAMNFGKLNFAVGFNRTSAFPLDANSYFENYEEAVTAAAGAAVVGSSDSAYYIGQLIIVNESGNFGLYQISADKTLIKFGQASSADDLKSQLDKLAKTVEGLNTSKADWSEGTAPVDKNGEIVTIGAAGSITASGIKIVNSAVNNSTTEVPTSKAVQTYVASQVASAVQYLGTVSALTGLSQTAGKGDFYRLSAAVAGGHAGDLVIAEKDNPAQLIDGTNWSLIHGEEVGVEAINAGDGIKVITTGEGSSEAQPTIAMKPATTTTIGGIIVGTNLTVDATGKLSAKDTTYDDATTTTHGLMTAADKIKLNGIAEGANKTTVDSSFVAKSTNPVESQVVQTKFAQVRKELADASSGLQGQIDDHATLIGNKVDKVEGKGLSTNDYTTEEKNKLADLENYTLPVASEGDLGGIKVGYSGTTAKTYAVKLDANNKAYVEVPWENTTYINGNGLTLTGTAFSLNVASSAMHGGIKLYNDKLNKEITPQAASEVNGRYYRIQLDNANRAFVNVPWTDTTYTLPIASDATLGGVKVDSVESTPELLIPTTTPDRDYAVKADEEGVLWVTIPWTDTKYALPIATTSVLGGVKSTKTGTTAGKNYSVEVNTDGTMKVNVPWTDTNTFRTIQIDTAQTDPAAPLNLKSGTNISLALDHGVDSENVTINHTGPGSASQTTTGTKADSSLVEDGGTVAFGKEFYVPSFGIDANGHTRDLKMTKYSLPTPETYSLQIATATVLGGIKSGNKANNFVAGSAGEGQTGNAPNYEAEVVVNSTTGKATVNLKAMAGPETQWSIVAGQTVFGIREVSTDKLVQGTNTLIINGGGAAW